jgi:hypothetical protein
MQGRLEPHFFGFVRHIGGAEVIDDLELTPAQRAAKKADVFFVGRRVVCEVKVLASDTSHKIAPILEPYEKSDDWPVFFGERPISKILELLPDREVLRKRIYDAVAGGLTDLVRDANRQIRETKESFGLATSEGIVVILNDTIDILDPNVMAHRVGQALLKRERDGSARFPHVGFAWLLCETHTTQLPSSPALLSVVIANPRTTPDPRLSGFMDELQQAWAFFNRMPMYRTTLPIPELANIPLRPITGADEPAAIRRNELWRRQYRSAPYLRPLNRTELLRFGESMMDEFAKRFSVGAPKPDADDFDRLGRTATAFFEEIEHRNMDIRELTAFMNGL